MINTLKIKPSVKTLSDLMVPSYNNPILAEVNHKNEYSPKIT